MFPTVEQTKDFIKHAFKSNPHFSFNNWSIMYKHSLLTVPLAQQIAFNISCDKKLVSIGALLHDIGKTKKAPTEILHINHEQFNSMVSEPL